LERVKDKFNVPVNPDPSFAPEPPAPAPSGSTSTNGTATSPLPDGTILSVMYADPAATAPSVGDAVLLDGVQAPPADYPLPDGSGITVGPDGTITALIAAGAVADPATDPAAAEQAAAPVDAGYEARFAETNTRLTAIETSLAAIMEKLGAFEAAKFAREEGLTEARQGLELLSDQFEKFLKVPSADPATVTERETRSSKYKDKRDEELNKFADALRKKGKVQA
jgi:hypothetical protein